MVWARISSQVLRRRGSPGCEEKARENGVRRGTHKEDMSPKGLARKRRGTEFPEFLQPTELEDMGFRFPRVVVIET